MVKHEKILWGEGMFLRPQHFQQQDLYHESQLAAQASLLFTYPWGIRHMEIDREALASGILRVTRAEILFPDGAQLHAPDVDNLPEPASLSALPATDKEMVYYLGLPPLREFGGNFAGDGQVLPHPTRYVQSNRSVGDYFTNAVEAETALLRKQPRLLSQRDSRDHYISIPVAKIVRSTTGGFELATDFWNPLLSISASDQLFGMLRRLVDILLAKTTLLSNSHREASKAIVEFRSGDVASFWLLQTANTGLAALKHLFHHPQAHPERLFIALSDLAGGLMTFAKNYTVADLPVYNHQDPAPPFVQLDGIIRELLETVISSKHFGIPLELVKPSYYLGRIDSDRLLQGADFYLGVAADMSPAELVSMVPTQFKIGAPDDVERVVLSAMPGVKLRPAPQVPSAIPVRAGTYYFSLEPQGTLYERMLQSRAISIYAPTGFSGLKLELMAVTQ